MQQSNVEHVRVSVFPMQESASIPFALTGFEEWSFEKSWGTELSYLSILIWMFLRISGHASF